MTDQATAVKLIVRVEAQRFVHAGPPSFEAPDHGTDYDKHVRTWPDTTPAGALAAFHAEFPAMALARGEWHLTAYTPSALPRPARHLMNWEKNPDAEVSDGWLSNLAAHGNTVKDELEWQPQYCTRPHLHTPCPSCTPGRLIERTSQYGGFYVCSACDFKTGTSTRKGKAAWAATQVTGWCGTPLVMRYNGNGIAYPACPACDPEDKPMTVNDIVYGRRR